MGPTGTETPWGWCHILHTMMSLFGVSSCTRKFQRHMQHNTCSPGICFKLGHAAKTFHHIPPHPIFRVLLFARPIFLEPLGPFYDLTDIQEKMSLVKKNPCKKSEPRNQTEPDRNFEKPGRRSLPDLRSKLKSGKVSDENWVQNSIFTQPSESWTLIAARNLATIQFRSITKICKT